MVAQIKNKKLVQINTVCNTSTGKIMKDIQSEAIRQGYDTISFVGRRNPFKDMPCEKFGNPFSFWIHVAINTVFDRQGYGSWFSTKKLIRKLREEDPDIIHLHNLHGYYLNLPVLFRYLHEEFEGEVFWTFHDCWPFTGHCPYFTMAQCDKWKKECHHCPNKTSYPISYFRDASRQNYYDKKRMFSDMDNLTVIVPSEWMADLVKHSFMNQYPIKVMTNGIDRKIFSYKRDDEIYRKYEIPSNKKILLGVANVWDKRKGLDDFIALSQDLADEYRIVLVGLSKRQIKRLPDNIIGIEKTENQNELAILYSIADIFINPSREESFSLVTAEAFACGTPVIALNTSAVKELITPENGVVIDNWDVRNYLEAINSVYEKHFDREKIAKTAEKYDNKMAAKRIVDLYGKINER